MYSLWLFEQSLVTTKFEDRSALSIWTACYDVSLLWLDWRLHACEPIVFHTLQAGFFDDQPVTATFQNGSELSRMSKVGTNRLHPNAISHICLWTWVSNSKVERVCTTMYIKSKSTFLTNIRLGIVQIPTHSCSPIVTLTFWEVAKRSERSLSPDSAAYRNSARKLPSFWSGCSDCVMWIRPNHFYLLRVCFVCRKKYSFYDRD